VHLVSFQILDRQKFKADLISKDVEQHDGSIGSGYTVENIQKIGNVKPPAPFEAGWKDTAVMYPGDVTRIMARFDRPGRYVYHCHILSHEDHEMMRAYHVGPWDANTDMPYDCDHEADQVQRPLAFADGVSMDMSPNPMNPSTTISFTLPQSAHVRLTVFDVRGRMVKVLMHGDQTAGAHRVTWTGDSDSGAQAASGAYFARLETDLGTFVQKVILVE
jgi:spore coat protein A